jgi:CheY-like chemotaxis protein
MNIPTGPILVVEDNPNVREMIDVTLRFKGYPVVTANNGLEALDRIAQEKPALVITDILMPRMDGYSLVHQLSKGVQTRQIPIIFITATYLTPEDKNFALSLGAVRFVEKPIDTEDFLLTVAEVLTAGIAAQPEPLDDWNFYQGYRARLEYKLRHKHSQVIRTERLLDALPAEQKPAFEALRTRAINDRSELQAELDELDKVMNQFRPNDAGLASLD